MKQFFCKHCFPITLLLIALLSIAKPVLAVEIEEGQQLYKAYCSQCHGLEGDGYGVNAPFMAVQPKDHTEAKEMNARTDDDLFKAIKFGGKAVNKSVLMPAWEHNLSDKDISALVAYLRKLSAP